MRQLFHFVSIAGRLNTAPLLRLIRMGLTGPRPIERAPLYTHASIIRYLKSGAVFTGATGASAPRARDSEES